MTLVERQTAVRPSAPPKFTWIEVEPLPKTKAKEQDSKSNRIVQTREAKKSDRAAPDAFLGAQTQIVDSQTVSRDRTTQQGAQPAAPQVAQQTPAAKPLKKSEIGKLGLAMIPQPSAPARAPSSALSPGGVPQDYIKGMKEGESTALNTREYVFYGYFQRIRERLDRAWTDSLRHKMTQFHYRGRRLASNMDHTTKVLVTLDSIGAITRVQVVEASGTRDLDEAAVKAFNQAGPFPNPPKGILDPSGSVQIRWEFVLRT